MKDSNLPQQLLVSSRVAAQMLGISPRTLWSRTRCGDIPSIRIGRAVRYSPDDLRQYIDAQREGGAK